MDAQETFRSIRPLILGLITQAQTSQVASGSAGVHDLGGTFHTGTLRDDQAPQFLLADGTRPLIGDLAVSAGVMLDGVDLSALNSSYLGHIADPNAHHLSFIGLKDDSGTLTSPDGAGYMSVRGGAGLTAVSSTNTITFNLTNGGGLVVAADTVSVGAGPGITVNTANVALTTPGSLSVSSTNASTGSHTHAVTASSSPGAAASLLATSDSGGLTIDTTLLVLNATNDKIGMGRTPDTTGSLLQAQGIVDLFVGSETQPRVRADPASGLGLGGGSATPDAWITRTATKQGKWYDGTGGGAADFAITGKLVAGSEVFTSPAIATFRSQTEALRLEYDAVNYASLKVSGGGNLEIVPTGDVIFNPTGNDILPLNNYDLNLGAINKKYLTIHAAELWVETLVAQDTIATIGGRILVGPTTTLTTDLSAVATTIVTKHNQMRGNDVVYMEANGRVEFMQIVSGPTGTAGNYSYVVTRNLDGTGANPWNGGDALFNTGTAGSGFIDLYSLHGVNGHLLDYIYNYDNNGNASPFEVGVFSANYAQETSFPLFGNNANTANNDAMYFGVAGGKWNNVYGNTVTSASGASYQPNWEYWNGTAWTSFTPTASGTWYLGGGAWSYEWTIGSLTGWAAKTVNGQNAFWVRWRVANWLSAGTPAYQGQRRVQWRARTYGPTIAMNVRNSTTFNDWGARTVLGNLNGNYDYGLDVYGFAAGNYATTWLAADETNGFRVMNGAATKARWYTNGNILIGEQATGQANLLLSAGRVQVRQNTTDYIVLDTTGIRIGESATGKSSVFIDTNGNLGMYTGAVNKLHARNDGSLFIGKDVSTASTVNLAIFGTDLTYNGEALGDGDLLLGDNSSGKANMLWDKSDGRLKFRGGTTAQLYIDTDGTLGAVGDQIRVDRFGITFKDSGGTFNTSIGTFDGLGLAPSFWIRNSATSANAKVYQTLTNGSIVTDALQLFKGGFSYGSSTFGSALTNSVFSVQPATLKHLGRLNIVGTFGSGDSIIDQQNLRVNSVAVIGAQGNDAGFWKNGNAYPALTVSLSDTVLNANSASGSVFFSTGGASRARVDGSGNIFANGYVSAAGAVYASNWFRTYGLTGWYSQDYTVGISPWQAGWAWINNGGSFSSSLRLGLLIAEDSISCGIGANTSANNRMVTRGETSDSTKFAFLAQNSSAANLMSLRNDGQVWVNQAWTVASDRDLKDAIRYLGKNDVDRVLALRPTSYVYKIGGQQRYGFIAQDVQDVEPTMVSVDSDTGMLGLDETGIIALLTIKVQQQERRIAALEGKCR